MSDDNPSVDAAREALELMRSIIAGTEIINGDYPHLAIDLTDAKTIAVGVARNLEQIEVGIVDTAAQERLLDDIRELGRATKKQHRAIEAERNEGEEWKSTS